MKEIIFDSQLLKDGHLYCPEKYAKPNAVFKVIVSLPEPDATQNDIETASIIDTSEDFLSQEELNYYLNLD
jgi:hypothetical protein